MTPGDYVAAFASIILALAVTDLAHSMHRLLRARKRVRWDWLPLAVALLILFATLEFWWAFFDVWRSNRQFTLGGFLPTFTALMLLFFCASAALPDDVPAEGLNLESYYMENRTYFWSLFLLLAISATVTAVSGRVTSDSTAADVFRLTFSDGSLALVGLSMVLLATKNRWVHSALVLFILAALAWRWFALTISA